MAHRQAFIGNKSQVHADAGPQVLKHMLTGASSENKLQGGKRNSSIHTTQRCNQGMISQRIARQNPCAIALLTTQQIVVKTIVTTNCCDTKEHAPQVFRDAVIFEDCSWLHISVVSLELLSGCTTAA
jgi:hypothetical protein